jgi:cyd operon protein YbgT
MWYFSWILGTGLALSFAVLNAIWYEIIEQQPEKTAESYATPLDRSTDAVKKDS